MVMVSAAPSVYGQSPSNAERAEPDRRVRFGKLLGPLDSQAGLVRDVLEQGEPG